MIAVLLILAGLAFACGVTWLLGECIHYGEGEEDAAYEWKDDDIPAFLRKKAD